MLKKLIFALALGIFAIAPVSAQTKVDKYLGTWNMVSQPKGSKYKMVTLTVSVDSDALKVEKLSEDVRNGKENSWTTIYSYKLSGATSAYLPSTSSFGSTYMSYLSNGKLRLVYNYDAGRFDLESLASNSGTREDWSLSDDGKTLTVDVLTFGRSQKFVYSK